MIPFLKKENIRQLTLLLLLTILLTSITLPLPTQAQTAGTDGTVSDGNSQPITISRVWQSTLQEIPFTCDVALDDADGYAQVLENMNAYAESFAGIYEQNGSMDYCILETVWSGYNTTNGKLPETLSVSAGDSFPVTLTYTGTLQAPSGYVFSEGIDVSRFEATLTLQVYETVDDLPQIPLLLPDDVTFYLGVGLNYSPEMTLEEIESELNYFANACIYFLTEDDMEVYPSEIQWDLTDIVAGTPGTYTAKATFPFPARYSLPQEAMPLSIPIHIRDDNSLEIYLDSVYSDFWGTAYYGSVYLPKDAEAVEGYLPGYFIYCGEDKPTAAQLDALTFTPVTEEDETIYFFEVYGYGHHSEYEDATIYIDLSCIPNEEQQGWYAFYVETAGYTSNYILLNTKHPVTLVDDVEGTRGGDTNSNFPDTEQEAPDDTSEPEPSATPTPTVAATPAPTVAPTLTDSPGSSTPEPIITDVPTSTPTPVTTEVPASTPSPVTTPELTQTPVPAMAPKHTEVPEHTNNSVPVMEQDTTDSMTLSGVRINTLLQNGNALVVSKNNTTAHFSVATLESLRLTEADFLTVTLIRSGHDTLRFTVTKNGLPLDTLPSIEITLHDIPYREGQEILHMSKEQVSCHDSHGHLAFTTDLTGDFTITSHNTANVSPVIFLIIGLVILIMTLVLFILLRKKQRSNA